MKSTVTRHQKQSSLNEPSQLLRASFSSPLLSFIQLLIRLLLLPLIPLVSLSSSFLNPGLSFCPSSCSSALEKWNEAESSMNMALVAVDQRRISHSFERDQNRQSAASETFATLLSHVSPFFIETLEPCLGRRFICCANRKCFVGASPIDKLLFSCGILLYGRCADSVNKSNGCTNDEMNFLINMIAQIF